MVASIEELIESLEIDVAVRTTTVDADSPQSGFLGSPTILVNGVDVDPAARDLTASGAT